MGVEDFFGGPELPETSVIKTNADVVAHVAEAIAGSNDLDSEDVKQKVELLSNQTDLPIAIGFGIKDSNSALSVKELADGIVAGSVFVDLIGEGGDTVAKISKKTKELSLAIK